MMTTNVLIILLVGVVALLAILCCCMGYAIGSKDDRLNRLSDENRDLKDVIQDMEQEILHARKARVFITHSGCDDDVVEMVRSYLEGLHHFDEILITHAGSVVSSHCGPGTLGVLYILE